MFQYQIYALIFLGGGGHSEINNRYNCILFEKNIQNKKQ